MKKMPVALLLMTQASLPSRASRYTPTSLASRILCCDLGDAGIALDLDSGSYWRLNARGATVVQAILAREATTHTAQRLALAFHISLRQARRDMAAVRSHLETPGSQTTPCEVPLTFEQNDDGFTLLWQKAPLLRLGQDGSWVRRLGQIGPQPVPVATALLWSVPHLLTLKGHAVLHASAVCRGQKVSAFSGASGAGKTTLAAALATQEGRSVSEDLVVLDLSRGPRVLLDAEPALRTWVAGAARTLERRDVVLATDLLAGAERRTAKLAEVLFLDASRRTGNLLRRAPLAPIDAMEGFLANSFAELGGRAVWRQVFDVCRRLALEVPVANLHVPNGLDRLASALRAYKGI